MTRLSIIHIVLFLLHGSLSNAQGSEAVLNNNYHEVGIQANGHFFEFSDSSKHNSFKDFPNQNFMDFSGMWIIGKKSNGEKVGLISKENSNSELKAGPIDTLFNKAIDNPNVWNHVWNLDQEKISKHKSNWEEGNYQADWNIKNWPSKHNQDYVPEVMAPFIDWNMNSKYDPENGDYPYFRGDQMLYFIANDEGKEHKLSGLPSMNIEIQGQVYSYSEQMKNVVFVRLFLINRSDQDYDSVFFGQYNHFQLGNSTDNLVATNVNQNSVYGYQGDAYDENGFNDKAPFSAMMFLNEQLASSIAFNDNDSVRKFPSNISEVWNTVNSNWRKGEPLTYGGKGYSNSNSECKYIYPHLTDQNHSNKMWNDPLSNDGVGLRNIIGFTGPFSLKNNQVKMIDFAFVNNVSEDSILHSQIAQELDQVKSFYNRTLSISNQVVKSAKVLLYPNPVARTETYRLQCDKSVDFQLINSKGQILEEGRLSAGTHQLNTPRIPGFYHLVIRDHINSSHYKLVVQ